VSLQQKTIDLAKAASEPDDNPNPEVPIYSGETGGYVRGYILGAGMYGLITGIIKSKLVRVIAPFIIAVFIVLGYLLYKQISMVYSSRF
jgi:biotin transporter BioY